MTSRLASTVGTPRNRAERPRSSRMDQVATRTDRSRTAQSPGGSRVIGRGEELTPKLEHTFHGDAGAATAVSFAPDMKRIVSSCADKVLMVWGSRPQLRAFRLKGHTAVVHHAEFSPDGAMVASASGDRTVRLWNPSALGGSTVLKGHMGGVRHASFSTHGRFLITSSEDKTVKIWSVSPQKFVCTLTGRNNKGHNNWVRCATFSPDSRTVVSCGEDKTVRLWDVHSQESTHTFFDHDSAVAQARFHPDGNCIASCSADRTIKVWDVRSRQLLQHYPAHDREVTAISFHASGNFLLSSSADTTVKVWDLREGRLLFTLRAHQSGVTSCAFSADGSRWASGGADGVVLSWRSNLAARLGGAAGGPGAAGSGSSTSSAPKPRARAPSSGVGGGSGSRPVLSPRNSNARRLGLDAARTGGGLRRSPGTSGVSTTRVAGARHSSERMEEGRGGGDASFLRPGSAGSPSAGYGAAVSRRASSLLGIDGADYPAVHRERRPEHQSLVVAEGRAGSKPSVAAPGFRDHAPSRGTALAAEAAPVRGRGSGAAAATRAAASTAAAASTIMGAPEGGGDFAGVTGRGYARAAAAIDPGAGTRPPYDEDIDDDPPLRAPAGAATSTLPGVGGGAGGGVGSSYVPELGWGDALQRDWREAASAETGDGMDFFGSAMGGGDGPAEGLGRWVGGGEPDAEGVGAVGSVGPVANDRRLPEQARRDDRELPEPLAGTLDHIVRQLDMLVRAVGMLEERQSLLEDRLSRTA